MFVVYLGLGIILLVVVIYFGLELSKDINHYILKTFFWILYLATTLTWINIVATVLFYNVLRHKRGPPGVQGPVGEKGDKGRVGMCDTGCKNKVCYMRITTELNKHYVEELKRLLPDLRGNFKIQNSEFLNIIKKSCHSEAFNEISKVRKPDQIIVYMSSIFRDWLTTVLEYDSSSDKKDLRTYLETDGMEEVPQIGKGKHQLNPIDELKQYDIYYWGKERIFHPLVIQYCSDPSIYKQMSQKDPPKIKAIRTNMYTQIYSHLYATGNKPVTFFRTEPYNFKNTKYYPLGDIVYPGINIKTSNKFVERHGVPDNEKEKSQIEGVESDGPEDANILVNGPDKYIQPPLNWELIWRSSNGSPITIWKPEDHYDHKYKKWFRGCGYLVMNNHGPNPRYQYGHPTPENQPIRLVSEDLLEDISEEGFTKIWDDTGSGSYMQASIWISKNLIYLGNQFTGVPVKGYNRPKKLKTYLISSGAFYSEDTKPIKFENKLTHEEDLGIGYHGTPHRNPKYSIFTWLEMPLEVQVSNLGNGVKIYLTHSGLNEINSYMIRKLKNGKDKLEGAFGVDPQNNTVTDNFKYNPSKENLRWKITCIKNDGDIDDTCSSYTYLIKSESRGLYLTVELDKSGAGEPDFRLAKLPNKNAPHYKELMNEFIWFNPKSATGNRLLQKNVIQKNVKSK
jgi:hypothetical protein